MYISGPKGNGNKIVMEQGQFLSVYASSAPPPLRAPFPSDFKFSLVFNFYFLYHIREILVFRIFLCSWKIPNYSKSACSVRVRLRPKKPKKKKKKKGRGRLHTVHESFACGWATGDIDIHGNNSITSSHYAVGVVVVSTTIGAATHADYPSGIRHLIVNLAKSGSHLVSERTGHDHNIRLTWSSTENDSETILIVSWGREMHHFDGAAS
jgi:hypothetical protein